MGTSRVPRVTRRRFLKETGLTLAAATAASAISAPFVVARPGRHQDAKDHPVEPFRPGLRQMVRWLRQGLGRRRTASPSPSITSRICELPARAAAEVSARSRPRSVRLQRLGRPASLPQIPASI